MATVETSGASIYYEVHGTGPAVVFAHGAGGNALSWWQQVPRFARRFKIVVFDHRGYGRSRCSGDDLDPGRFVADLAAILDAEKIARAALVAQSMGGFTALPFTVAHPERVTALVLCGTPGGVQTEGIGRAMAAIPQKAAERGFLGMVLGPEFPARHPSLTFLYEQINGLNPAETLALILPRLAGIRVDPGAVRRLTTPTLVLAGTHDSFFSPSVLREVSAEFAHGQFVEIEGVGHSTYFEAAEDFNDVVETFLRAHVG